MLVEVRERRRFTVDEVVRMVDAGVLSEDEPVELIEGELIVVPPQGPPHASRVSAITAMLARAYPSHAIRPQLPLVVGADSLPEPDVAVVRGSPEDHAHRHPRADEAVLVVEIARTSQALDRAKASLYARGRASVYWLVDVAARRVEERTEPTDDGEYRVTRLHGPEGELALPGLDQTLSVAALLGPELG